MRLLILLGHKITMPVRPDGPVYEVMITSPLVGDGASGFQDAIGPVYISGIDTNIDRETEVHSYFARERNLGARVVGLHRSPLSAANKWVPINNEGATFQMWEIKASSLLDRIRHIADSGTRSRTEDPRILQDNIGLVDRGTVIRANNFGSTPMRPQQEAPLVI